MSNETYHVWAYTLAFAASLLIGLYALVALAGPFKRLILEILPGSAAFFQSRALRTSFWLLAVVGFTSVSMTNCTRDTYEEVIASRPYLESRAKAQVSASIDHVTQGLLFWGGATTILLIVPRRRRPPG